MTAFLVLFAWAGLPLAIIVLALGEVRRLAIRARHIRILYSFCEVRDLIALKAIQKTLDTDSEIFRFFYSVNAGVIHTHPEHGKCFVELMRAIYQRRRENRGIYSTSRIGNAIENADDDVKQIVRVYVKAFYAAMFIALPWIIKDEVESHIKLQAALLRLWSKIPFVSEEQRESAKFGLTLAEASGQAV